MREAPSIVLAGRLLAEGAKVRGWDPVADGEALPAGVEIVGSVAGAVRGADAAVIVTEWPELRDLARAGDARRDGEPADRRRPEPARPGGGTRRRLRLRGHRPAGLCATSDRTPSRAPMEAIILCGGKAERLGDAAGGRPKSLVEVGGRPLAAYQVGAPRAAGVERVIMALRAGQGELFERELAGLGPEIIAAEEPERLGRGGGIKFAAQSGARPATSSP